MNSLKRLLTDNPKIWVIFGLLFTLFSVTAMFEERFRGAENLANTMRWVGLYGIISIGVTFVIITGGIDLSIGALIALTGVLTPMLLTKGEPFFGNHQIWLPAFLVERCQSLTMQKTLSFKMIGS